MFNLRFQSKMSANMGLGSSQELTEEMQRGVQSEVFSRASLHTACQLRTFLSVSADRNVQVIFKKKFKHCWNIVLEMWCFL